MESTELQQLFFSKVKTALPPHLSMVDEIAGLLNLSHDSVYRRVRGEKPITIAELKVLCDHFRISLDQVLQIESDAVVFQAPGINDGDVEFQTYISGILQQLKYFNSFEKKEMLYLCKDLPFWHFYTFPELGAFKTFCWIKTIQNHSAYANKRFSLEHYSFPECVAIGSQILEEYCKMPSVELWNIESITSSIRQLEYYKDAELFEKESDYHLVLDSMDKMLDHFQKQAETGMKFMPGATELTYRAPFQFYVNEVILGNNTIMVELNGTKQCFINYNVLNYLITRDSRFTKRSFDSFHNLLSRSTIISGTGEKYRNKFFRHLREKVQMLRDKVYT
jgi:hypothetical protein